jgi:hypothetical protein
VTTAAASMPARTAGPLRSWLSVRHSLRAEALVVLALYGLYELARGLVVGDPGEAVRHARELVALERSLHIFVEGRVQDAAHALPGLIDLLGMSYLTLHLAVTVAVLLWLHQRRPVAFPLVRTTLLLASALALVGYLIFPTAPPRLSGIGISDTVSGGHIDLNTGLVSSLYNPYAAVPSMHMGYALVVGAAVARQTRRRLLQATAAFYPALVLLVIVATGNHFLLDAAAGAAVSGLALLGARLIAATPHRRWRATETRRRAETEDVRRPCNPLPFTRPNPRPTQSLAGRARAANGQQTSEIGLAQPSGIESSEARKVA